MAVSEREMEEARARLSRTIDENNITDALTVLDKAVGGLIELAKAKVVTDGISADTVSSPYGSGPGGGGPGTPAGKVTADMVLDAAEEILARENNPKMKRNQIPGSGKNVTFGPYDAGNTSQFFKARQPDDNLYDEDEAKRGEEDDLEEGYGSWGKAAPADEDGGSPRSRRSSNGRRTNLPPWLQDDDDDGGDGDGGDDDGGDDDGPSSSRPSGLANSYGRSFMDKGEDDWGKAEDDDWDNDDAHKGGMMGPGGEDDDDAQDPLANLRNLNAKRSRSPQAASPDEDDDAPSRRSSRRTSRRDEDARPSSRSRSGQEDESSMDMGYGGGTEDGAESMARSFRRSNIHKSLVSGRNGDRVAEVVEASQELAHMVNVFGSYLEHLSGQVEQVRRDQFNSNAILTDAVNTVVKSQSAIAVGLERMAKSATVLAQGVVDAPMNKSINPGVLMNGRVLAEGATLRRSGALVDETGHAVMTNGTTEGRLTKSLVGSVIQESVIAGEFSAKDALRWLTETDSPTSGPVAVYRQLPAKLQERIAQKANEQD